MSPDSWKRPSAVDDAANVMSGYETQLQLNLNKPADATPEQFKEWQETELKWWADQQFKIVIIATIVQFTCLAFMFSVMALNSYLF